MGGYLDSCLVNGHLQHRPLNAIFRVARSFCTHLDPRRPSLLRFVAGIPLGGVECLHERPEGSIEGFQLLYHLVLSKRSPGESPRSKPLTTDQAPEFDSDWEFGGRRKAVGTPSANASAAHWGYNAFLQGKVPGATSPKGPSVQVRAVFGGVAPAPQAVRSRGPTRPGHPDNYLIWNELARSHLLRLGLPRRPGVRAFGHFPRTGVLQGPVLSNHSPIWGKWHGEGPAA